jgi:hypothetical protein
MLRARLVHGAPCETEQWNPYVLSDEALGWSRVLRELLKSTPSLAYRKVFVAEGICLQALVRWGCALQRERMAHDCVTHSRSQQARWRKFPSWLRVLVALGLDCCFAIAVVLTKEGTLRNQGAFLTSARLLRSATLHPCLEGFFARRTLGLLQRLRPAANERDRRFHPVGGEPVGERRQCVDRLDQRGLRHICIMAAHVVCCVTENLVLRMGMYAVDHQLRRDGVPGGVGGHVEDLGPQPGGSDPLLHLPAVVVIDGEGLILPCTDQLTAGPIGRDVGQEWHKSFVHGHAPAFADFRLRDSEPSAGHVHPCSVHHEQFDRAHASVEEDREDGLVRDAESLDEAPCRLIVSGIGADPLRIAHGSGALDLLFRPNPHDRFAPFLRDGVTPHRDEGRPELSVQGVGADVRIKRLRDPVEFVLGNVSQRLAEEVRHHAGPLPRGRIEVAKEARRAAVVDVRERRFVESHHGLLAVDDFRKQLILLLRQETLRGRFVSSSCRLADFVALGIRAPDDP